jgi:SAM-dependent methyltransferase
MNNDRGLDMFAESLAPLMKPRLPPPPLQLDLAAIDAYTPSNPEGAYTQQARPEMQVFVPATTRQLLDIGCSEGLFGEAIRKRLPGCEVWGVEPSDAAKAAEPRLNRVLNVPFDGNTDLPAGIFDVVTMNDCLEHIYDTDGTLAAVKRLLRPDGLLILSLPNVAFGPHNLKLMMKNNWDYQDDGILDRTHVRFFTADSITKILQAQGYIVELTRGIPGARLSLKWRIVCALFPKRTYWWRFFQFAVVARKPRNT